VAAIERGDLGDAPAFGRRDHRSVDAAKREVVVASDELGHSQQVGSVDRFEREAAGCQIPEESHLGLPTEPRREQVGDLGDDEAWNKQRTAMALQQVERRCMLGIIAVDVRVERARVDDQRDRLTSAAMISSMRSEMSDRPLRPAAAAPRRRRPPAPMCSSSAVRVTSAMVVPRR